MIIYTGTEERLVPAQLNIVTLEVAKGGYIYIDRTTYEQAAVLKDKYCDDWDGLCKMVGVTNHAAIINALKDEIPEPINYLVPFISLVDEKTEFDNTLEQFIGCLYVISRNIDFTRFLKIPAEVRRSVTFSGHIKLEYSLQWQEFINECVPYQMIWDVFAKEGTFANAHIPSFEAGSAPKSSSKPKASKPLPEGTKIEVPEGDEVFAKMAEDEELMAALLEEVDIDSIDVDAEIAAMEAKEAAEKVAAKGLAGPTPAQASITTTTPATNPAQAAAESGKALLDDWGL